MFCRICPGYNVAERSLAVAIIRILWAFDIKHAPDAKLPLNIADWRGDFPGLPGAHMPVMMLPRSDVRVRLINEAFDAAKMEREHIVILIFKWSAWSTMLMCRNSRNRLTCSLYSCFESSWVVSHCPARHQSPLKEAVYATFTSINGRWTTLSRLQMQL